MKSILFSLLFVSGIAWAQSIEIGVDGQGPVTMLGDVTGSSSGSVVLKINGTSVSSATPSNAQVLTYNSTTTQWEPRTGSASGLPGLTSTKFWVGNSGDLPVAVSSSGDATFSGAGAFKVLALQGKSVSSSSPSDAQLLLYNSIGTTWVPSSLSGDVTVNVGGASSVLKIQGVGISTASPSSAQVLTYNSVISKWNPQSPSASGSTSGANRSVTTGNVTSSGSNWQPVAMASCTNDQNTFCGTSNYTAKKTGFHMLSFYIGNGNNTETHVRPCYNGTGTACGGGAAGPECAYTPAAAAARVFCNAVVYLTNADVVTFETFGNGTDVNIANVAYSSFLEF